MLVDSLDLLADHLGIVLELLHLAVHLVHEAVAFLAGDIEEPEVVLVGCYLLLQLVIAMHKAGALAVDGILTFLRHAAKVVLEVVEMTLGSGDVKILVYLIHHIVVLLVRLILLTERHMTDSVVLVGQFLHLLSRILTGVSGNLLQFLDDVALLLQVLFLLSVRAGVSGVACVKKLVAGREEFVPQLVTDLTGYGADGLPLFLKLDELVGGRFPIRRVGKLLSLSDERLFLLRILVEASPYFLEIFSLPTEEVVTGLAEALEDLFIVLLRSKAYGLPFLLDSDDLFRVFLPVGGVLILLLGDSLRLLAERRLLGKVLLFFGTQLLEVLLMLFVDDGTCVLEASPDLFAELFGYRSDLTILLMEILQLMERAN